MLSLSNSLLNIVSLGQISAEEETLRDIVGPVNLPNYGLWISLLLGGILFLLILFFLLKRKKKEREQFIEKEKYVSPYDEAMQGLNYVRNYMDSEDTESFSVSVSRVLRRYIERQLSVKAGEMTTEEFLPVAVSDERLKGRRAELLTHFLQHVDLVKFAKQSLGMDKMKELYDSAEHFITETNSSQSIDEKEMPSKS